MQLIPARTGGDCDGRGPCRNMLQGEHLGSIPNLRARNSPAITVLERGRKAGVFRADAAIKSRQREMIVSTVLSHLMHG